jgi:hypothetical protein
MNGSSAPGTAPPSNVSVSFPITFDNLGSRVCDAVSVDEGALLSLSILAYAFSAMAVAAALPLNAVTLGHLQAALLSTRAVETVRGLYTVFPPPPDPDAVNATCPPVTDPANATTNSSTDDGADTDPPDANATNATTEPTADGGEEAATPPVMVAVRWYFDGPMRLALLMPVWTGVMPAMVGQLVVVLVLLIVAAITARLYGIMIIVHQRIPVKYPSAMDRNPIWAHHRQMLTAAGDARIRKQQQEHSEQQSPRKAAKGSGGEDGPILLLPLGLVGPARHAGSEGATDNASLVKALRTRDGVSTITPPSAKDGSVPPLRGVDALGHCPSIITVQSEGTLPGPPASFFRPQPPRLPPPIDRLPHPDDPPPEMLHDRPGAVDPSVFGGRVVAPAPSEFPQDFIETINTALPWYAHVWAFLTDAPRRIAVYRSSPEIQQEARRRGSVQASLLRGYGCVEAGLLAVAADTVFDYEASEGFPAFMLSVFVLVVCGVGVPMARCLYLRHWNTLTWFRFLLVHGVSASRSRLLVEGAFSRVGAGTNSVVGGGAAISTVVGREMACRDMSQSPSNRK